METVVAAGDANGPELNNAATRTSRGPLRVPVRLTSYKGNIRVTIRGSENALSRNNKGY